METGEGQALLKRPWGYQRAAKDAECVACQTLIGAGDRFCKHCGAENTSFSEVAEAIATGARGQGFTRQRIPSVDTEAVAATVAPQKKQAIAASVNEFLKAARKRKAEELSLGALPPTGLSLAPASGQGSDPAKSTSKKPPAKQQGQPPKQQKAQGQTPSTEPPRAYELGDLGQGQANPQAPSFVTARRQFLCALRLSMLKAGQDDYPNFDEFCADWATQVGKLWVGRVGAWMVAEAKVLTEELSKGVQRNKLFKNWCRDQAGKLPRKAIVFDF